MGLDLRLSYKTEESIYEGNGKTAFAFVRNWVLNKGEEFDFYGKDIQLTKEDVDILINSAIAQWLGDFDTVAEVIKDAISDCHTYYYTEFLGKLLAIKGSEDYSNYYLECDW